MKKIFGVRQGAPADFKKQAADKELPFSFQPIPHSLWELQTIG